jgi:hypothetical protein
MSSRISMSPDEFPRLLGACFVTSALRRPEDVFSQIAAFFGATACATVIVRADGLPFVGSVFTRVDFRRFSPSKPQREQSSDIGRISRRCGGLAHREGQALAELSTCTERKNS